MTLLQEFGTETLVAKLFWILPPDPPDVKETGSPGLETQVEASRSFPGSFSPNEDLFYNVTCFLSQAAEVSLYIWTCSARGTMALKVT